MEERQISSIELESLICLHCGQPAKPRSAYCCTGCAAAHSLIVGSGLKDFYRLAQKTAIKPATISELDRVFSDPAQLSKDVVQITESISQIDLLIENITCSACHWLLERVPLIEPEIRAVETFPSQRLIRVQFHPSLPIKNVATVFYKLGYPVHLNRKKAHQQLRANEMRQLYLRSAVAFASMIATMHVGLTLIAGLLDGMEANLNKSLGFISLLLSLPSLVYSAVPFYRNTWLALKAKTLTVDVLVTIVVMVGLLFSIGAIIFDGHEFYFDAITMLIALLLAGRLTVREMENRLSLQHVITVDDILSNDLQLSPGARIKVKSGEVFPCDGNVRNGQSTMDSSWMTGEPLPVTISQHSPVYAGAINQGDQVEIEVTAVGDQSRAGQILKLLQSVSKGKLAQFSQRLEQSLIAAVLLTLVTVLIWNLYSPLWPWKTIVALLLVVCPCALGLAVPIAVATALKQGLERGILIKGGETLERVNDVDAIVFDKTGTLTSLEYKVVRENWNALKPPSSLPLVMLKTIASIVVSRSSHILAKALEGHLGSNMDTLPGINIHEVIGCGLHAEYLGYIFKLGNAQFVGLSEIGLPESRKTQDTSIFFTVDGKWIATFTLEPTNHREIKSLFQSLRKTKTCFILSGDRQEAVDKIAHELSMDPQNAKGHQTPEEKLKAVENLNRKYNVMMVGDGINDILAFKKSHISVGVQSSAKAALEHCDIYLNSSGINSLLDLFGAAKKLRRTILLNMFWALVFNILGASLVLTGILGPIACALLMPLSSLVVILFSISQRYFPERSGH